MATAQETKLELKAYRDLIESYRPQAGKSAPQWLHAIRQSAFEQFQAMGFPSSEGEGWKYLNLEPLLSGTFRPEKFLPELSQTAPLPACVVLESFESALKSHPKILESCLAQATEKDSNAFSLINTFSFENGVFLYVPEDTVVDFPIEIRLLNPCAFASPFWTAPRILAVIGRNSKVSLSTRSVDTGRLSYFLNGVAEFYLQENSHLDLVTFQEEDKTAFAFFKNNFLLDKGSSLSLSTFIQGEGVSRIETVMDFTGEGAFASAANLSILSNQGQHFQHVSANHNVPNCTSRQLGKNILYGNAKAEFNSLVYVAKGAVKSDSDQLSRSLLFSDTARSYARPQLRIYNDDVKCKHGASIGQAAKEEIFYLESRGISKTLAQSLITFGFAGEVVERIQNDSLRETIESKVRSEIEKWLGG